MVPGLGLLIIHLVWVSSVIINNGWCYECHGCGKEGSGSGQEEERGGDLSI